jgi:glycosyltransferase involved in cell wall biosynthesis
MTTGGDEQSAMVKEMSFGSNRAEKPLVSVITPAYNRAAFLDETILSVVGQDYQNIEYLVLDDGSTDDTLKVIRKYEDKLKWVTHINMGEAGTVNRGFTMAKGDIVVVVNSDDPLLPGAVKKAVSIMLEHLDVLAAYPDWIEIGPNSELIREVRLPDYDLLNMLRTFNVGMGPGTFIRREAFDLVGFRDPQFRYAGDLEFWFRLALRGKLVHIPEVLATHRVHPESASVSDRGARMSGELVRVLQKVYADPQAPQAIRKVRRRAFSTMHYEAASYCGSDKAAVRKHYLASFRYHPLCFLVRAIALFVLPELLPAAVYRRMRVSLETERWRRGVLGGIIVWAGLKPRGR